MSELILILHNIRSTHNVGSLFRTAEGFGVNKLILSGYTPFPATPNDSRLPHIRDKLTSQIHKTALGAEDMVPFRHEVELNLVDLKLAGYRIVALEQAANSTFIGEYSPQGKIALLLGEEVHGIPEATLSQCDDVIEIPMRGQKESFNVSVAGAIAMYELTRQAV